MGNSCAHDDPRRRTERVYVTPARPFASALYFSNQFRHSFPDPVLIPPCLLARPELTYYISSQVKSRSPTENLIDYRNAGLTERVLGSFPTHIPSPSFS